MRFWRPVPALFFVAFSLAAQNTHKGHVARDYKMTEMPPPPRIAGIGDSHLTITTKSPKAQAFFDQGLNLLHCFWDFEAYRAFKEAARLDPNAAMAYWGIAETVSDYSAMKDTKTAALDKAKALLEKVSDHEQYYIRAQQAQQDEDNGEKDYREEMEALIDKYPDDIDAKLFLAIHSSYGYGKKDGKPQDNTIYARMLVNDVLASHPNSGAAHHYRIHLLEASTHPQDALADADALAKLVPGSGHMVHMPGHIYYRLGDYDRARQSFLDSLKVDADYMQREKVGTLDDWNYAHNLSYLIANDAESGRLREALEMAARLEKLPANPFLAKGSPMHVITVGGSAARLNIRFANWQAIVDHPINIGLDPSVAGAAAVAYRDGVLAYARGMLALSRKDLPAAARDSDALDATSWRLHAESDSDEDGKPDGVLNLLEMLSLDLRGYLRMAQGKHDQGIALLEKALDKEKEVGYGEPPQYGRPELESLGYAYVRAGKWEQARKAFQDEMITRPASGHALYGIAQSYELAGDKARAAKAYGEFLNAWKNADPDLPMVEHAKSQSR
ncbi:MAG TPA: tetratricopeptide repeat protein [Bryobacteraceae bacterium]|nr:tetratricopeptide repeat protein [Bryobacteraceae bacterium]